MIRQIQEKQDPFEYIEQAEARLRGMEELAATHIMWFTHMALEASGKEPLRVLDLRHVRTESNSNRILQGVLRDCTCGCDWAFGEFERRLEEEKQRLSG